MKVPRLALSMLLVVSSSGDAQQTVLLGARAGYVAARQVDDFGSSSALPGGSAGFAALFDITTWFGVEADVLYTQKGWRMDRAWLGLDYLELPLLMRLAVPLTDIDAGPDPGLQPFVLLGSTHSFLVKCSRGGLSFDEPNSGIFGRPTRTSSHSQFPTSCARYARPDSDLGLTIGTGVTLRRPRGHLTFEVRHTKGFENVVTAGRQLYPPCHRCTITNRATQLLFGATVRP